MFLWKYRFIYGIVQAIDTADIFHKLVTIRNNDGDKKSSQITSEEELQSVLINYFKLDTTSPLLTTLYTKLNAIQSSFQVTQ